MNYFILYVVLTIVNIILMSIAHANLTCVRTLVLETVKFVQKSGDLYRLGFDHGYALAMNTKHGEEENNDTD